MYNFFINDFYFEKKMKTFQFILFGLKNFFVFRTILFFHFLKKINYSFIFEEEKNNFLALINFYFPLSINFNYSKFEMNFMTLEVQNLNLKKNYQNFF
jgi:hypothetical protein